MKKPMIVSLILGSSMWVHGEQPLDESAYLHELQTQIAAAEIRLADLVSQSERAKAQPENQTPTIKPDEITALEERVAALEKGKKDEVAGNPEKCEQACTNIGHQYNESGRAYHQSRRDERGADNYLARAVPEVGLKWAAEARQSEHAYRNIQGGYERTMQQVEMYCPADQLKNRHPVDFCRDYLQAQYREQHKDEPCYCGSGKKFGECHGTEAAIQARISSSLDVLNGRKPLSALQ